jgi:hypothetical protein
VATDWTPVVQTAIGAVAATGGGFAAAWMQGRSQLQLERQRKREAAADTLVDFSRMLGSVDPRLIRDKEGASIAEMINPSGELRLEARERLWRLAASHPARRVRRISWKLDTTVGALVGASWSYLELRAAGKSGDLTLDAARGFHRDAERLLAKLIEAL